MELLLNLLWLVIAAGAVATYLREKPAACSRFRLGLGALMCICALLLPAISITDDLHFDAFAVEDSSSIKKLTRAEAHAGPVSHIACFGISLPALWFALLLRSTWSPSVGFFEAFPDSLFPRPALGRAPPRWLVSPALLRLSPQV
jgi:hypothetical protein